MTLIAGMLASTFSNEKIEEEDIERLKQGDILESTFTEFAERSEKLFTPLIAERDEYMAAKLKQIAARPSATRPRRVLVVIGAGHLKGMKAVLTSEAPGEGATSAGAVATSATALATSDVAARLARLETTPPSSRWVKAIPWLILVVVLAGFAVGFLRSPEQGVQLLTDWTLITAGLAGVGTLLALAHPLTILATMVAAPFTTLNPLLGAGFVAAGVELWLRKPSVGDFERLKKDVTTWRGWWTNRAARVLLVFVLSTLGASAGTFLAGARIFGRLLG
jgi:pheromone shutdown protein TraB